MKYKDFDSYNINEASLMGNKSFGEFEIEYGECEESIFKIFPGFKFVLETNRKICYVYSDHDNRKKYKSLDEVVAAEGDISDYVLDDVNGQFIIEQYAEMSNGITIVNVYKVPIPENEVKKQKKKEVKKKKTYGYYGDDDDDIIDDSW